jgi:hypothetical protein
MNKALAQITSNRGQGDGAENQPCGQALFQDVSLIEFGFFLATSSTE